MVVLEANSLCDFEHMKQKCEIICQSGGSLFFLFGSLVEGDSENGYVVSFSGFIIFLYRMLSNHLLSFFDRKAAPSKARG